MCRALGDFPSLKRKEKVFCGECKYFERHSSTLCFSWEECHHSKNTRRREDTYKEKGRYVNGAPKEINKNNDCPYFERK